MSSGCPWKPAVDPRTGRTYYYHEVTRETQWRKPMELASEKERMAMESKEQKQKDFFSAMEANILNSLSQGQVPGTQKKHSLRKKSSRKPPQGDGQRPELIRTISTMDETVLNDLIRRQPSFRNVVSKQNSIQPGDMLTGKRGSAITPGEFSSFASIVDKEQLDRVEEDEGLNDSMPELFSYLPDEGFNDSLDDSSFGFDSRGPGQDSIRSQRSDAGKFNESSLTGFGLTWEETQALKKLADITKEMIDAESDDNFDFDKETSKLGGKVDIAAGATPSWKGAKDSKGMRDLPREIEFSSDEESGSESEKEPPVKPGSGRDVAGFQKARDIGGRELEFDSSDEDEDILSDSDYAPTPVKPSSSRNASDSGNAPKEKEKKSDGFDVRPEVKRRNTCGTIYVGTTMSAPDKDATIKCVCGVYRSHIMSSELDHAYNPEKDPFRIFNDQTKEQGKYEVQFHNDDIPKPRIPSLEELSRFYRDIFYKAQMENDCMIMSLIYVERLIKRTNGLLRPRANNWRSLIFSCMILSSKVWDDLSMWNADFSQSCPPGVAFPLKRINELELAILNALGFQVKVPASEYAKYYFLLRSMLIKSGLGDETGALNPLDVVGARRLQEVSSQFENSNVSNPKRSQSLAIHQLSRSKNDKQPQKKINLEHVVKM